MTMAEAIQALGVSRSTIERRIKKGALTGYKERGRWVIDVPVDESDSPPDVSVEESDEVTKLKDQVATLTHQLDETRDERDRWRDEADKWSVMAAETQRTLRNLTETKALPAPDKRPWWQFWGREEAEEG